MAVPMTSYWNGSAWADFVSPSTSVSATLSTSINDSLGQPKKAQIRISNQSDNPFANSGSSKGPYTGVIGDFTPIKMRDGDTNEVIFYGFAEKTAETYQQGTGMVIDIDAVDHLQLLTYTRTDNSYSYNINPSSAVLTDSVRNNDVKDDDKKEWTKNVSGRSGIIKSILNQFAQDITHPSSTSSDVADDRFTESVKEFTENQVYNLSDRGKKPALYHISDLSTKDPHAASGDQDYGYDYYLDANVTDFSADQKPAPYFNYFKRATRPATNPATYGLSITLPSPDDTASGSFTQTGQRIAMTEYDFKRPKSGVFSEADVDFVATQGEDNQTTGMSSKFELITTQNTNNVSAFKWSGYELGGGVAGTDSAEYLKVLVATLDGAVSGTTEGTFVLDGANATDDFYVGQRVSSSGSEIMTVASITNGTTMELNRSQEGTTATGGFADGGSLYMRDVARIQYTSGTADVGSGGTTYALISDIDKSLTEDLNNSVWTTGDSSKVWTGQSTTGSSFKLKGRPRITLGIKKTVSIANDSEKKNAVRESIAAALMRNTTQTVEADIKTYETPKFYFDNSPSGLSGTNANAANPYVVTLVGSVNPEAYGFKVGMVVVKLDSSGTPTSTYGYASATSSTTVNVYMNGSITTSDTLRYIVPVRAGDIIKVRNDLVNFDGYMLVTNIDADMSAGINLTRFQALGSEDAKEAAYGKANVVKRIGDFVTTGHNRPPNLPFAANPADSVTTCEFTSTTANQVNWGAGRITVNGNIYNITAGNTGALNADGREYYVYVTQGSTTFTTVEKDSFVPDEKNLLVATVKYNSPEAFFMVICREMSFKPQKLSADGTIVKYSVSAQLQKKGTQPWSTSVVFSGSDYDSFAWASGALSFADDDTEAVSSGSRDMSAAVEYVYKLVGDSANATLQITSTYSDVFDDDKVLLATVARSSDTGAGSPTILPFNGNVLTISAGAIAANSIVAANIKAGTITADEISAGSITAAKLETNLTVSNTIRTASSGARVEITSNGIQVLNAPGSMGSVIRFDDTSGDKFGHLQATTYNSQNTLGVYAAGAASHTLYQVANFGKEIGYSADAEFVTNGSIEIHDLGEGDDPSEIYFTNGSVQGSLYISGSNLYLKDSSGSALGNIGADFRWGDGDNATPTYSFSSDADTGMYRSGADELAFATDGAAQGYINDSGFYYTRMGYTWGTNTRNYINGTTGGSISVYTGAHDGTGVERLKIESGGFYNFVWGSGSGTNVHVHANDYFMKETSSIKFKENVVNIESDTSKIYDLRPVTFTWNDKSAHPGKKDIGLIAEETEKIYPEIVNYGKDGWAESISYQKLSVLLLSEMKKLKDEMKELKEDK